MRRDENREARRERRLSERQLLDAWNDSDSVTDEGEADQ
jgi:hypothetical protein